MYRSGRAGGRAGARERERRLGSPPPRRGSLEPIRPATPAPGATPGTPTCRPLGGAEERVFQPGWRAEGPFTCLFVGKLIPLHGLETILEAARIAPELPFRLVGSGQLEAQLERRPANVEWVPWVEYELLSGKLHRCGCALGIFGTSPKASRVIPNKVFQALACGAPVVTADTPAARELLADGESALLVPPGDSAALATTVRRLADDDGLRQRLAAGGRSTYEQRASEIVLGARWRGLLERLVH